MNRHLALICMICLIIGTLHADNTNKPSLQIADNTFFDPTKKEKKVETYEFDERETKEDYLYPHLR